MKIIGLLIIFNSGIAQRIMISIVFYPLSDNKSRTWDIVVVDEMGVDEMRDMTIIISGTKIYRPIGKPLAIYYQVGTCGQNPISGGQ